VSGVSGAIAAAAELLREHPRIAVACHEGPDGDALGSLVGCGRALARSGWDVALWAPGAGALPDDYAWLGYDDVRRDPPGDIDERLLVTLDCGSAERLGAMGPEVVAMAARSVNIDHHGDNTLFADLNVVDPQAASTTILVHRLLDALDLAIDLDTATALYVGIVTDTGRFMYANADADCHRAAAELIERGVEADEVFRRLYEGHPPGRALLLGRALTRLELRLGGRLAATWLTIADLDETGADEADSEGAIDHLRAIRGVEVAALVREPRADGGAVQKCSLRSAAPAIDVSRIAHAGGGGGHAMAAGFSMEGSAADVIALVERELGGA
jgi:phosphoesterase RecJ-like protein